MSKDTPWTKLDPGTCAWAKAKMSDAAMGAAEKAYVEKIHLHCELTGKPPGDREPPQRRII